MKKILIRIAAILLSLSVVFAALPFAISAFAPEYKDAIGNNSDDQKIKGLYLLKESAKREDNVIIYGSSELRTNYISTHPANFFENKKAGFQVNLVGRGSCQSIIHAMSIAASGSALSDTPVVLITSPQSYVEGGITPDMFFANFSEQQYITIMYDSTIPDSIKMRFSKRVLEMFERYDNQIKKLSGYDDIRVLAALGSKDNFTSEAAKLGSAPYFLFRKLMADNKDKIDSYKLINDCTIENSKPQVKEISYKAEEFIAVRIAQKESDKNDFGMRNADYDRNVKNNLKKFENKDKNLSYTNSVEYNDLELLLEICELKGIKPLFVSVPLHGQWSDYTGFSKEKRQEYYEKVKKTVSNYNAEFLDLSGYEYDQYFLCDTMHLGWKGWLKVNEEIDSFYHRFRG